jgi:hypothetical protein
MYQRGFSIHDPQDVPFGTGCKARKAPHTKFGIDHGVEGGWNMKLLLDGQLIGRCIFDLTAPTR